MDSVATPTELEKTAYHEVGHTLVAKLLGRTITSIMLFHTKQTENWEGIARNDPPSKIDSDWATLNLDQYIPYTEFQLHYPKYPELHEKYGAIREECIIKYAGWVTEALLYKQLGLDTLLIPSDESAADFQFVSLLLQENFPPQDWKEELLQAENHTRKILSNHLGWCMVENLAKEIIDAILHGKEPLRQDDQSEVFKFSHEMIYESFRQTLTTTIIETNFD